MVTTHADGSPPAPIYALKRVPFAGRDVTVVLQADNGPCPLLAAANALLLRGALTLPPGATDFIPEEVLLAAVREYLLRTAAAAPDANAAAVLNDALALLPSLSAGLDVNVRFGDVEGFEYTRELSFFDLAGVRLLHGWVVDPQEPAAAHLRERSYNQAVEALVAAATMAEAGGEAGQQSPAQPSPPLPPSEPAATPAATESAPAPAGDAAVDAPPAPAAAPPAADPFAALVSEELKDSSAGDAAELPLPVPVAPPAASPPSPPPPVDGAAAVPGDGAANVAGASDAADGAPRDPQPSAGTTATAVAAATIDSWLRDTSSQLTYAGLLGLHERVKEGELAVLFRNCHFGTLHKAGGRLYTLVTDVGYRHLPQVVWEGLDEVDDSEFYDARFAPCAAIDERAAEAAANAAAAAAAAGSVPVAMEVPVVGDAAAAAGGSGPVPVAVEYRPGAPLPGSAPPGLAHEQQQQLHHHDPDFLLALRLQQEEEEAHRREAAAATAAAVGALPAQLHPSLVAAATAPGPQPHNGSGDPHDGSSDGGDDADDEAAALAAALEASRREYEAEQQRARALGYAGAPPAPAPALTITRPPPVATGQATPTPRSSATATVPAAASAQPQPAPRVPQPGRNDRYGAQAAQLRAAAQAREARRGSQASTPSSTPSGADGRSRSKSGDGCVIM